MFFCETMFTIGESRIISHVNDTELQAQQVIWGVNPRREDFPLKLLWRTPIKIHQRADWRSQSRSSENITYHSEGNLVNTATTNVYRGSDKILQSHCKQHQPHLNPRKSFFLKENWVEIYSNQKAINDISHSNIRTSVETRPPKLHNLLQFSPPSIPDILRTSPPPELREVLRYTYF